MMIMSGKIERLKASAGAAQVLILGALLAACNAAATTPDPSGALPAVTITAKDFAFEAPAALPAGWVQVTLNNAGAEGHHVQLMQLNEGVSLEQFNDALQQGEGPALALVTARGGVGALAPASAQTATVELPAGNYVLLCFLPSPDGTPHLAKGMVQPVTVAAESKANAPEPQAEASVDMADFEFTMPDTLPAGRTLVKVANRGAQMHEWNLLKLSDGTSPEAVGQWFAAPEGPPPFTQVGGMNGLAPDSYGFVAADLEPGQYLAICLIPDPATGQRHLALGMLKTFSVQPP